MINTESKIAQMLALQIGTMFPQLLAFALGASKSCYHAVNEVTGHQVAARTRGSESVTNIPIWTNRDPRFQLRMSQNKIMVLEIFRSIGDGLV